MYNLVIDYDAVYHAVSSSGGMVLLLVVQRYTSME